MKDGKRLGWKSAIRDLLQAARRFERKAECDMQIVLFSDGSGHVMVPMERTDPENPEGYEEDFGFDSIGELGRYLAAGKLHGGEDEEARGGE